jgi:hypothetical protein
MLLEITSSSYFLTPYDEKFQDHKALHADSKANHVYYAK